MNYSLINIFKELSSDTEKAVPSSGNLENWAGQGVLLLKPVRRIRLYGKTYRHWLF